MNMRNPTTDICSPQRGDGPESENVLKYIQEVGFRTLEEIKTNFSSKNLEILTAVIDFLISKNKIRKIKFQASSRETKVLFYVVSNE